LRISDRRRWCGNPFPKFFIIHQTPAIRRGTFVTSDKSTQKRRLKLRFKTSSARCALPQTCFMFLAQSPFPCAVVGQKDCAPTAFRYRFAAAAPCHGSHFPLSTATNENVVSPRRRRGETTFSFLPISFLRQCCHALFRRRRYSRG